MKIRAATDESALTPGHFGARVVDAELWMPPQVVTLLKGLGVDSAETLVSYLHTFPSEIASRLEWDDDAVEAARHELVQALTGHVDSLLLRPDDGYAGPLGAFDPEGLK